MKTNGVSKTCYCLAASLRGEYLTIDALTVHELCGEYYDRIDLIRKDKRDLDRRAFTLSVEWERLGDFLASLGWNRDAAQAYCQAAYRCLDGTYYDYGKDHYPCRRLRERFCEQFAKLSAYCLNEDMRWELFGDGFLYDELKRFSALEKEPV